MQIIIFTSKTPAKCWMGGAEGLNEQDRRGKRGQCGEGVERHDNPAYEAVSRSAGPGQDSLHSPRLRAAGWGSGMTDE